MRQLFLDALQALYGGTAGAEQQAAANSWLNAFAAAPEAWPICLELMAPTAAPTTAFFCANLLLTKMRREWGRLPAEQRSELLSIVRCGTGRRALQE